MTALRPVRTPGVTLGHIARSIGGHISSGDRDVVVFGVELASSRVEPGDLFVALPGQRHHGATFVDEACARGAGAVLTDDDGLALVGSATVPVIVASSPREVLGLVARDVFGSQDERRLTFGVTGTNGKTSIAYCLWTILESLAISTALSTTAERRIGSRVVESGLTTPEATELHAFLALARESDVKAAVLEVSAHALSRHRVRGVAFDVVAFANLSHDHLDDYATMDDYFEAKARLFSPDLAKRGVVCVDDSWGRVLSENSGIPVTTVSLGMNPEAHWQVDVLSESLTHTTFRLRSERVELQSSIPVMGEFMALNAALSIVMLLEAGISEDALRQVVEPTEIPVHIPGRLEVVSGSGGPTFLVDYGHTPEAFRVSLEAIRRVCRGRVFMVFGADGDRDSSKRHAMGGVAAELADVVIVTDFHPRSEDPAEIRSALIAGALATKPGADIREIADPTLAVREAIREASDQDVILYAGPGHESYREVAGAKIPYDARADVRAALSRAGYPPRSSR